MWRSDGRRRIVASGTGELGKVSAAMEQMVFVEATSVLPLLASDAWHRGHWRDRAKRGFAKLFD